MLQTVTVI